MKQIRQEQLKEVLDVLEEVFRELHVDFYMIGAIAKEYWYRRGNKRMRQTKDVDFAILVPSRKVYDGVRERLKHHRFAEIRGNHFVMISPNGLRVDLLPFGEISIDDGFNVTSEGRTSIAENGFMEVYMAGTARVEMETGHVFKAATLPGIVLLKLIAYDDRPEDRQKDAGDIAGIIQHFFDLQPDLIYEHHNDLFVEDAPNRELPEIAAIVIGREMKKMCGMNHALMERLRSILVVHIEKEQASTFIRQMVTETGMGVREMVGWLTEVKMGLDT